MSLFAQWVLAVMISVLPPSWLPAMQRDVPRLRELVIVSVVIADASEEDPLPGKTTYETAAQLIQIGLLESGFSIHAIGKAGEVGVFQIMGISPQVRLRDQAREALRRWRVQGPEGYTGEANAKSHPLADHRRFGAALIAAAFAPAM